MALRGHLADQPELRWGEPVNLSMGKVEAGINDLVTLNGQMVTSFEINGPTVTLWYTPLKADGQPAKRRKAYYIDIVDLVNKKWFGWFGDYEVQAFIKWHAKKFESRRSVPSATKSEN